MPTSPDELRLIIRPNGQVIICHRTEWDETEAIELPPHGRLIDGDNLYKRVTKFMGLPLWVAIKIEQAPTIIEAEVDE